MAKCGYCTHLDPDKCYEPYDKKYWCDQKGEYIYADKEECWLYCKAYDRHYSIAEALIEASRASQSSGGCFITTITCEILGKEDNCIELQKLRQLRDNYLQKNEKYHSLLMAYDIYGPKIAEKLRNDKNNQQICSNLFNLGIKKVVEFIDKNDYNKAINLYTDMTALLIQGYNIRITSDEFENIKVEDPTKLGHGHQYVKKYA